MKIKSILRRAKKSDKEFLGARETRQILKKYKMPLVDEIITKEVNDAIEFAKKKGYPIVLKVVSPDITHKTDVGAIILDIENEKQIREGFYTLSKRMKKNHLRVSGILVQKMVTKGHEVIVGGKKDPTFGQTIAFGLGGIFVEIFDDISFRIVPIKKEDAEQMIKEVRAYKILTGFRGRPRAHIKSLINILMKASKLLKDNPEIKELDLNPVFALPRKALVVDARIIC